MAECIATAPIYGDIVETGWNEGYAWTDTVYTEGMYLVINPVGAAGGAAMGLNSNNGSSHYSDLNYGFIFQSGEYNVVENGVLKTSAATFEAWEYFVIQRFANKVYYCKVEDYNYGVVAYYDVAAPGVPLLGELLYISAGESYEGLFIDSSLYSTYSTICYIDLGVIRPDTLDTSASAVLLLPYDGFGADDSFTALLQGELGLTGTGSMSAATSIAGKLGLEVYAGDVFRTEMRGHFKLTGSGSMTIRYDELYDAAQLSGYLGLTGYGSATAWYPQGVANGDADGAGILPLVGWAQGSEYIEATVENALTGQLPFTGTGAGRASIDPEITAFAGWLLGLTGGAAGRASLDPEVEAAAGWQLGITLVAAGDAVENANPEILGAVLNGELGINGVATSSADRENYFHILMPYFAEGLTASEAEISEDIIARTALQIRYVNLVREFIEIATTPRTFTQLAEYITDTAYAVATTLGDFALWIQEDFDVTADMEAHTVLHVAEEVLAAGIVQSITQAIVAVLSAMTVTDGRITGGSAEGATAGVACILSGPPIVEFVFTGWWQATTEIQLNYTTDVGPGYISYTFDQPVDAGDAMVLFTAALDAQPLVNATFDGTSVTMTAQSPATTVQL